VLPAGGGEPWIPGGPADQGTPAGGQPWGQPWEAQAAHQDASSQPGVPGQDPYGQAPYGQAPQPYGQAPQQYGQSLPPEQHQHQHQHQHPQQAHQPYPGSQPQQPFAQPLPPEAVPGAGDADATQYIAPVPGGPGPGAMPPENPAEATQFLAQGMPPQQQPAYGGDAEATQYIASAPGGAPYDIRPGAPGDRQPPAEFDNLFREDGVAGATQQMPQLDHAQHHGAQQGHQPHQPHQLQQAPQPRYQSPGEEPQGRGGERKKRPHLVLIGAVVAGCAVVGLGAGALMSSGGDKNNDDKQPVASAGSPAEQEPAEKAAEDPVKTQAEALDKLLADSNNSRSAVIDAVEKTKKCQDLGQAESNLRDAAQQRRDLVTRLQELSVDKLPDHERLTAALTEAWQASASADDHYAAWAKQAQQGKKVCKHGRARMTSDTQQAAVSSGKASKAKQQASDLWNVVASEYGLTRRAAGDL